MITPADNCLFCGCTIANNDSWNTCLNHEYPISYFWYDGQRCFFNIDQFRVVVVFTTKTIHVIEEKTLGPNILESKFLDLQDCQIQIDKTILRLKNLIAFI